LEFRNAIFGVGPDYLKIGKYPTFLSKIPIWDNFIFTLYIRENKVK